MKLTKPTAAAVRDVLQAIADGEFAPWIVSEARRCLPAFAVRAPLSKVKAPGRDKAAARAERKERLAAIVEKVRARSEDDCQICGNPGHDAHHVASGPQRRHRESAETMLWICRTCHHLWHAGNEDVLLCALDYCRENGMRVAAAEIDRRLTKIAEARGASRALEGQR